MASLLALPLEIKRKIQGLLITSDCIHITADETIGGNKQEHIDNPKSNHNVEHLMSLSMTCRQLYREMRPLVCEQLCLSFASGRLFTAFMGKQSQNYALPGGFISLLSEVHLDMGPGKHGSAAENKTNILALKELAKKGTGLRILSLSFHYYHRASSDLILINRNVLHIILRFNGLRGFRLSIGHVPPGPVCDWDQEEANNLIQLRLHCLEEVLKRYVCQQKQTEYAVMDMKQTDLRRRPTPAMIREDVKLLIHQTDRRGQC